MSQSESLPPNYGRLDMALRSIGYSFEAAVADIIDNALDAHAKSVRVRIIARREQPLDLVVWDDGEGMSASTLMEAMRFGADVSSEIDRLGKFGLGLKLASLSQAKELKVLSLQNRHLSGRAWLENGIRDGFNCTIYSKDECRKIANRFLPDVTWTESGTLVCWSQLYRVGSNQPNSAEHAQGLLRRLRNYLSLAFHRFLAGRPRKVNIELDVVDGDCGGSGIPVILAPSDPFGYDGSGHSGFPATMKVADGYGDSVSLRAHIWPPNCETPNYRLPGGANSRQGFYFYRNNRLIQGGGWNGLREAEPHSSLARIEVEMSPGFDVEASLDVKKSEIQLPPALVKAIQRSRTESGIDFKAYLRLADEAYRTRTIEQSELPLIPSAGLPKELRNFLRRELRLKSTTKYRDLEIRWAKLSADEFFSFDRETGSLCLNRSFRKQLLHGRASSSTDLPFVKCLLFLLLRDLVVSQRTGKRMREEAEQLNRILLAAAGHEGS